MILLLSAAASGLFVALTWAFYSPSILRREWVLVLSPWGQAALSRYKITLSAESEAFLLAYREAIRARVHGTDGAVLQLIEVGLQSARTCSSWWERLRSVILLSRTVAAVAPILPLPRSRDYHWPLDWLAFLGWVGVYAGQNMLARWRLQARVFGAALKLFTPGSELIPSQKRGN